MTPLQHDQFRNAQDELKKERKENVIIRQAYEVAACDVVLMARVVVAAMANASEPLTVKVPLRDASIVIPQRISLQQLLGLVLGGRIT